jgi:hypothetical protein
VCVCVLRGGNDRLWKAVKGRDAVIYCISTSVSRSKRTEKHIY